MADLRISELAALAGINLAAGDLLPVVDVSASETKKITVTDLVGNATTLIADATIPGAKILFGAGQIAGTALANLGVSTAKLADDAVTAAKLADESTVDLVAVLPGSGAFIGQLALDVATLKIYCWNGSAWQSIKAAGSINTVIGGTSGIVNLSVSTSGDSVTITTSLDNTAAAAQFLAGPTGAAGAASYRTIAAGDLPTATTGAKGAVQVNGNGLVMSGDTLQINNTVTANAAAYHVVQYTSKGLVTGGRTIQSGDLPLAGASAVGAIYPGTGLSVAIDGQLNHTNAVTAGTYPKITFNAQGHVTAGEALVAADIPEISTDKLTSGLLPTDRIASDAITGEKLANSSTAQFGATQPTAEYTGQLYFNSLTRDIYIWDGNVWQPIGISVGEIVFAGTYNASTNLVASVTSDGTAVGLVVNQPLPAAAGANNRYYLVVSQAGTGIAPAPTIALSPPDILLSNGSAWTEVDVSQTITSVTANAVSFTPSGGIVATNVQAALQELDSEKLPVAGGTVTGNLEIGITGSLTFEGSTANAFETTLGVVDPTVDRSILLPDVSGTVVTTGDTGTVTSTMIANGTIVDGDIASGAAIAGSKIVAATTSVVGAVQLTDSTSSTSTTTAATPNSVKTAYDLAVAALPKAGGTMTGAITFAAGQTISGYGLLDGAQTWTKGQRAEVTALTDAATIAVDFADSNNFSVTLAGNRTLGNPTNQVAGQSGSIFITQDATGSKTLAYGANWDFAGGAAPTLSTAANAVDRLDYIVRANGSIHAVLTKAFS
jgi:hypothetical protein